MKPDQVKVRFEKRDGRQHVFYTGPGGRELPLLDRHGDLYDLAPETYGRMFGDVHELIERITTVCKMPA